MTWKGGQLYYEFDPFALTGRKKPDDARDVDIILEEVGDTVIDQILNYVGSGSSPVSGGKWKSGLSKEYKKQKSEFSSSLFANMEKTGEMLDSLEVWRVGDKLRVGFRDEEQANKADGHNQHSGRGTHLPLREFIPKEGKKFKSPIQTSIKDIIDNFQAIPEEEVTEPVPIELEDRTTGIYESVFGAITGALGGLLKR